MIDPCVFCDIAAGRAPYTLVAGGRDIDDWLAFRPLGPHAPGHALFIPRRHIPDAAKDPAAAGEILALAAAYVHGRRLQANILTSVGAAATQTVGHLHVHVIPRGSGDGLPTDWPWMREGLAHAL